MKDLRSEPRIDLSLTQHQIDQLQCLLNGREVKEWRAGERTELFQRLAGLEITDLFPFPGRPSVYELTHSQLCQLLTRFVWRDFTVSDWNSFNGCETSHPRIGEIEDYLIIQDGAEFNIMDNREDDPEMCGDGGRLFSLNLKET